MKSLSLIVLWLGVLGGEPAENGAAVPSGSRAFAAPDTEKPADAPADKAPPPAPPLPPTTPKSVPPAEPKPPQEPPPAKNALTCKLLTEEAPRGGRLEVQGANFGQTPVVRIADKITRILTRTADTISVQIARDSDGGPVTVQAGTAKAICGWLTIIGKDR